MWRLALAALLGCCTAPAVASAAYEDVSCPAIPLVGESVDNMRTRAPLPLKTAQATARYRIDATLDPKTHTIRGGQHVLWRNRSDVPVCAVYLHVDLNAFEGHGSRYMASQRMRGIEPEVAPGQWGYGQIRRLRQAGIDAPWIHVQPDGSPPEDHTVVRVDLPQPVAPGATTELEIDFVARLPGAWAETGYAGTFHLADGWFPQVATLQMPGEEGAASLRWNARAYAGDRAAREPADFDVHVRVPRNYTVASTGESRGVALAQDHRDHHFVQRGARTFAWVADAGFVQPLEYDYFPPHGEPLRLRVLYRLGNAADAVRVLGTMTDALAYSIAALGAYPGTTLTAVVAPRNAGRLGGRAFPTLFTADPSQAPGLHGNALDRAALAAIGNAYFDQGTDAVFRAGVWRYWAERFERSRDRTSPDAGGEGWLRRLVAPWRLAFAGQRAAAATRMDADMQRSVHIAQVLHDLERRIGDTAVDQALRSWRRGVRAGYPDTSQTRWLLAEGSGHAGEFERAFAIIDAGIPADDRIVRFSSEEVRARPGYVLREGKHVEVTPAAAQQLGRGGRAAGWRTVVVARREGVAVPQTLTVTFADGSTRTERWDDTRTLAHFEWITPVRAVSAQLDPRQHVRLDRNKFDDGRTLAADLRPVRRWSDEVVAMVGVVASWLMLL